VFLESLPPYRVTKDIAEVEAFFATERSNLRTSP
jgi:hypothetical protein